MDNMKKIIGLGMLIAIAAVHGDNGCPAEKCQSLSDGLYFLFGVGVSSIYNGVDAASDIYSDTNMPDGGLMNAPGFTENDLPVVRSSGYEIVSLEPDPAVLPPPVMFRSIKLRRRSSCDGRDNKFSGVAGLGFGKNLCCGWYLGGEALLDFGSPHRTSNDGRLTGTNGAMPYYISSSGTTFSLALRFGYEITDGTRLYLKAGGAFVKSEAGYSGLSERLKMSKITPLVSVGIEQCLCGAFSTRLELEHRFVAKKEGSLSISDEQTIIFDNVVIPNLVGASFNRVSSGLRQKTKSWEVRLVFQHTVNWQAS
jgi:hypothetical protein